jgi:hypothetical protein
VPGKKITCTETILQQTRIVKVGNRTCVIFTKLLHIYDPQENEKLISILTDKISQQPENCENRNDADLVQAFLKKWWVESDFKAPNLPLSLWVCLHTYEF